MVHSRITIHTKQDFEGMRKAGRIAASILRDIEEYVKEGVTTNEINDICHKMILDRNSIPAPLNYKGFPKSICTSVNHVVCHGIPNDKKLKNGDIMNIDVTVIHDGWHGDTSRMYTIGKIPKHAETLIDVTYETMMAGIEQVKPGNTVGDIGYIMNKIAKQAGYTTVKDFCGHGIGKIFHAAPNILNYGVPGEGVVLEEGMFFTVEPMVNIGSHEVVLHNKVGLKDGWTVTTVDRKLSAQFEHTIGVTKNGYEIFTLSK